MQNRLLTTGQAAELLQVSQRTVLNWIDADVVPYLVLPRVGNNRPSYRIPLHGLLNSLSGNFDLGTQLEAIETVGRELGVREESVEESVAAVSQAQA
jgi:excisionase family DNA binding protein